MSKASAESLKGLLADKVLIIFFENERRMVLAEFSPAFHSKSALVPRLRAFHYNQV